MEEKGKKRKMIRGKKTRGGAGNKDDDGERKVRKKTRKDTKSKGKGDKAIERKEV